MRRWLERLFHRHVWKYETLPGDLWGYGRRVRSCWCGRFERREISDGGMRVEFRRVLETEERQRGTADA